MGLSRIPLGPGMDDATRDNIINENFRQIEAENRTKVIRDEQADDRIIIGKMPDGSYGIIISNEGVDVKDLFIKES